jgi:hypothetical protein
MLKKSSLVISALFLLSLLLGTFGAVQAAPLRDDPVVTVVSGAATLETKVIPLEQLPGISVNDSGLSLAEFSTSGMSQFGGDGVRVKGLLGSVASVCFTAKPASAGWTNTVHRWTGFTWEEVPTVVTTTEGGINPKACATIYYDGTYALLVGYTPPADKVVLQECANIEFIYPDFDWEWGSDEITLIGGYVFPAIDEGSYVRYQLLNIQPAGSITGDLTASGMVIYNYFEVELGGMTSYVEFPEGTTLTSTVDWWDDNTFTVRFYFSNCYKDFHWPDDFMGQ